MALKRFSTIFKFSPFLHNFLILLIALTFCAPILLHGALDSYDLEYHLIWVKHFTAQLAQGDIYPRWLRGVNLGAGGPTFYFYPPMAYYISAIPGLLFPSIEVVTQHAIGETLIVALSGLTFYQYARWRFAALPSLFAAIIYMILPYHFEYDLWTRQDLSEITNYIWLPLVIHYTERLFEGEEALTGLAIAYGCMMFTHLPTALLFSLGLAGYVLVLACLKPSRRALAYFITAIVIGILLAAIYWIPAVFCQQYIHAEEWWGPIFDFHLWFFPHPEMARLDAFTAKSSQRLFDILSLTTAIFILCWLSAWRWRNPDVMRRLWLCLVLAIIAWFFMSSWSRILWEILPLLWKVQFPWRIAPVLDLATAIAVLLMMNVLYLHRDRLTALVAVVVVSLLFWSMVTADMGFSLFPDDARMNAFRLRREGILKMSIDAPAHQPRFPNLVPTDNDAIKRVVEMIAKAGYHYDERNGSINIATLARKISFDIDLQNSTVLTVYQLYFPSWHASIVGSAIVLKITPMPGLGLIQIVAPQGKYRLQLEILPLKEEKIGKAASGFAVLLLLGRTVWLYRRKRKCACIRSDGMPIGER